MSIAVRPTASLSVETAILDLDFSALILRLFETVSLPCDLEAPASFF